MNILNPLSSCETLNHFSPVQEFKKMNAFHKAITVIATAVISLFTIGIAGPSYFKMLVGRFRKLEINENSPQGKTAKKTDKQRKEKLPSTQDNTKTPENNETKKDKEIKKTEPEIKPNENEEIEIKFWEDYLGNKDLHQFLQMVVINTPQKDADNIPEFLVSNYEQFLKPHTVLTEEQKNLLKKSVMRQLEGNDHSSTKKVESPPGGSEVVDADVARVLPLPNDQTLVVFDTSGDGSCGLHALLGQGEKGQVRCDAAKARKQFCDWIRNNPDRIENVLDDYFLNFNQSPQAFRNAVRKKYEEYHKDYGTLSIKDQDDRKKAFRDDKDVMDAYLKNMKKVGTYLLQDELIAAAECFDKRIVLHQPGWGNNAQLASGIFNGTGAEEVNIYYNGINHYEKAIVIE